MSSDLALQQRPLDRAADIGAAAGGSDDQDPAGRDPGAGDVADLRLQHPVLAQAGPLFSVKALTPDFSNLNPVTEFQRLFSLRLMRASKMRLDVRLAARHSADAPGVRS
jgi:hypothetical protein